MLEKHTITHHKPESHIKEMRTRLTCDICEYKTTSETVLKQHKRLNHEKKSKSTKRKVCILCDKQFNKEETLNKHMKSEHNTRASQVKIDN